jgi:hypothetical protein
MPHIWRRPSHVKGGPTATAVAVTEAAVAPSKSKSRGGAWRQIAIFRGSLGRSGPVAEESPGTIDFGNPDKMAGRLS